MAYTIGDLAACCSCCARGLPCSGGMHGLLGGNDEPDEVDAVSGGAEEDVSDADAEGAAPTAASPLPSFKLSKKTKKKLGGKDVLFGAGGVSAGATAGALIGSVVPGIGTVIGALVGAAAGGVGGALFGKKKKAKKKRKKRQQQQAMAAAEEARQRAAQVQQERAAKLARMKLESVQRSVMSQAGMLVRRGEFVAERAPLAAALSQDAQAVANEVAGLDLDDPAAPATLQRARQILADIQRNMLDAEKAGKTQLAGLGAFGGGGLGGLNPQLGAWLSKVRQANRVKAGLPPGRVPTLGDTATPSSGASVCWLGAALLVGAVVLTTDRR